MKDKVTTKFSSRFLFLAFGFLMLFNPFVSKAQSNSAINLGGVIWQTEEVVLPPSVTGDTDGSTTTAKRYYYFDTQGKVTEITVFSKSGGVELKLVPDLVDTGDGLKYRDRYRYVLASPDSTSLESSGTYTINGKSLTLEISKYYTVAATIYDDRIEGTLTAKSGSKSKWKITKRPQSPRTESAQNNSNNQQPENTNSLWLDGIWEGAAYQFNTKTSWTIKLTVRGSTYSIEYPSLSCGGKWTLVKKSSNLVEFQEKITYGLSRCMDDGKVVIQRISDSQVTVKFFEPNSSVITASTTLNKR